MCTAGLTPERTADPGRAFHLWSSDGAVIFASNSTDPAGMVTGARDVFGPRLFIHQSPTSTTPDHHTHCGSVAQSGDGNPSVALQLHIDGYTEFGDYYPDLVFLLCERQVTAGGELSLVDGQRLVDSIASNPTQRALSRFLWDVKLEHGRPNGLRSLGTGKAVPSRRPVASRTCGGRLTVRRHPHQRLRDDGPGRPDDRQHLAAWARLTEEAARSAPRFLLHPGDLLCLDNYRVFHSLEPYTGYDRILHTLWAWSDMAFGLPYPIDLALPAAPTSPRSHPAKWAPHQARCQRW